MTETNGQPENRPSQTGRGIRAPSENGMPDPQQVEERVESGEGRRSAGQVFGEEKKS